MPSLKDYLASVCHSAYKRSLPSNEVIDVRLTEAVETHVAPFDGYVECIAADIPNVAAINLSDGQSLVSLIPCYLNTWGCVWMPCKKGNTVTVNITGSGRPTLRFIQSGYGAS